MLWNDLQLCSRRLPEVAAIAAEEVDDISGNSTKKLPRDQRRGYQWPR